MDILTNTKSTNPFFTYVFIRVIVMELEQRNIFAATLHQRCKWPKKKSASIQQYVVNVCTASLTRPHLTLQTIMLQLQLYWSNRESCVIKNEC